MKNRIFASSILTIITILSLVLYSEAPVSEIQEPACSISVNYSEPPEVVINRANYEFTTNNKPQYVGTFTCTAYCSCARCCGQYAYGRPLDENGNEIVYTASGAIAQEGVTVAASSNYPFGTIFVIDGHEYTVQDRGGGVNGNHLDIYFSSHEAALAFGCRNLDVYILMDNNDKNVRSFNKQYIERRTD